MVQDDSRPDRGGRELDSWLFTASILPASPRVVLAARELVEDEFAGMEDLARLILLDPVLALRIMRLAVSTFRGRTPPETLEEALMKLGFQKVAGLLEPLFQRRSHLAQFGPHARSLHQDLATHALLTGLAAEELQRAAGGGQGLVGRARLLGLLHDIGRLVLLLGDHATYEKVVAGANRGHLGSPAREHRLFGFSHQELGARLALAWGLGEEAATVLGAHHRPGSLPRNLLLPRLVHLADWVALKVQEEWTADLGEPDRGALGLVNLDPPALRRAIAVTARRQEEVLGELAAVGEWDRGE